MRATNSTRSHFEPHFTQTQTRFTMRRDTSWTSIEPPAVDIATSAVVVDVAVVVMIEGEEEDIGEGEGGDISVCV